MLDEKKIRIMTQLAIYETKEGTEDCRICAYYKKDYSSFQTILAIIWVTVGYVVAVGIGAIVVIDEIFKHLNFVFLIMLFLCLVTGYIVLVVFCKNRIFHFYEKKYSDAYHRMRRFNHNLIRLNRMYEREKR